VVEPLPEDPHARMAGGYGLDQIDRAIRDLCPILHLTEPEYILVDLGGLAYVGPAALALLAAALSRLSALEFGVRVIPPRSPLTRNYLMRMDFLKMWAEADWYPEPFERKPAVGFRPCQHFTSGDDYWIVAKDLTAAVGERCSMDRASTAALRIALDEVAENVIHHADTPLGGFAVAQSSAKRKDVQIAIVDLGVGIRASLAKNPRYADIKEDVEAIATAVQPQVTSTPERNAGIGLYVTKMLLRANGGHLVVRSGYGAVYRGAREAEATRESRMPGTLVALKARTEAPLNLAEVYRQLDVPDSDTQEAEHD
jgi:anti-sigma regulatory factor (Ser/Thr protein kinase)